MLDFTPLRPDPLAELERLDSQAIALLEERRSASALARALAGAGTPPCELGHCPWLERCRNEHLACAAFAEYVSYGESGQERGDIPTRERYARLYDD